MNVNVLMHYIKNINIFIQRKRKDIEDASYPPLLTPPAKKIKLSNVKLIYLFVFVRTL